MHALIAQQNSVLIFLTQRRLGVYPAIFLVDSWSRTMLGLQV